MYICWFHDHIKSSTDVSFYFNPTIVNLLSLWKMTIIKGLRELSAKNMQIQEQPFAQYGGHTILMPKGYISYNNTKLTLHYKP